VKAILSGLKFCSHSLVGKSMNAKEDVSLHGKDCEDEEDGSAMAFFPRKEITGES
jgi:hypothetical protein